MLHSAPFDDGHILLYGYGGLLFLAADFDYVYYKADQRDDDADGRHSERKLQVVVHAREEIAARG